MARLLRWTVVVAALAAVVAFVPMGGRTLLDRWRAARGPGDFAVRVYGELEREGRRLLRGKDGPAREAQARAAQRPAARPRPGQAPQPVEHHTDADRKALDAIVAEHAR